MTQNEQSGFDPALYDADFFVWTQRQAAAMRAMPRDASVDIARVAEEIQDLGKRDLREVSSFLERLIEHLLTIDGCPASRDRARWLLEASHFHGAAVAAFTPGMRQLLSIEKIWKKGRKDALLYLEEVGAASQAPEQCPFTLEYVLAENLDLRNALDELSRVREKPSR